MKGFAIKASMSEMVSRREGGKTVGVKVFLAGDFRKEVLEIKDDVDVLCMNTKWRRSRLEDGVEVGCQGLVKKSESSLVLKKLQGR